MIPNDLRLALVEKLIGVPGVDDPVGRTALLLAGIPATHMGRNLGNAHGDVLTVVLQLEESFGPNGEWRLLQLVNNALPAVQGTDLGAELRQILKELLKVEQGLRAVQVHPAEVAQVHLFDLRQPVLTCVASLPSDPTASGFVVTTPTPRLLAYFCESLKQRGAEYHVWSRDQVAPTATPLVIDPKHTAVTVLTDRSAKFKSLLAKKHVIWPIYVDNAADAAAAWQMLRGAFQTTLEHHLEHHLVIAFGMPTGTDVPAGMTLLPAPRFTSQDVSNWLNDICKILLWRKTVVEWWAKVILVGCVGSADDLPIETVYEKLELHSGLITQYRDPNDLMDALRDLELIEG